MYFVYSREQRVDLSQLETKSKRYRDQAHLLEKSTIPPLSLYNLAAAEGLSKTT